MLLLGDVAAAAAALVAAALLLLLLLRVGVRVRYVVAEVGCCCRCQLNAIRPVAVAAAAC